MRKDLASTHENFLSLDAEIFLLGSTFCGDLCGEFLPYNSEVKTITLRN